MNKLYEMANIRKTKTGLPFNVWIIDTPNHRHGARLKVQQNYSDSMQIDNTCSVSVDWDGIDVVAGKWKLTAKDYNLLQQWIHKNQDALVDVYYGDIDIQDFFQIMKKV